MNNFSGELRGLQWIPFHSTVVRGWVVNWWPVLVFVDYSFEVGAYNTCWNRPQKPESKSFTSFAIFVIMNPSKLSLHVMCYRFWRSLSTNILYLNKIVVICICNVSPLTPSSAHEADRPLPLTTVQTLWKIRLNPRRPWPNNYRLQGD